MSNSTDRKKARDKKVAEKHGEWARGLSDTKIMQVEEEIQVQVKKRLKEVTRPATFTVWHVEDGSDAFTIFKSSGVVFTFEAVERQLRQDHGEGSFEDETYCAVAAMMFAKDYDVLMDLVVNDNEASAIFLVLNSKDQRLLYVPLEWKMEAEYKPYYWGPGKGPNGASEA